jgi:hypothetical protein
MSFYGVDIENCMTIRFWNKKTPFAIRNFCKYALDNFIEKPEYLFLIGKAYYPEWYKINKYNYSYPNTLVPSFGTPPSDVLLTAGLTTNNYMPAIATGRLAAKNDAEVRSYLNKVIEYEKAQEKAEEWQKIVLHFGGGSDSYEQNKLANFLQQYKQ